MRNDQAQQTLLSDGHIMTDKQHDQDKETRLEKARIALLETLNLLRENDLSGKEADAVEAAIEDELIALRVTNLCSGVAR
jgi:hypothetical protein